MNEDLVVVKEVRYESEALILKGLLESAGIESMLHKGMLDVKSLEYRQVVKLLVRPEDKEEALKILDEVPDE
jgi:hypothetical protein